MPIITAGEGLEDRIHKFENALMANIPGSAIECTESWARGPFLLAFWIRGKKKCPVSLLR